MCEYLGVVPGEDPYLVEVAAMAINAPLPDGWEEVDGEDGTAVFRWAPAHAVNAVHHKTWPAWVCASVTVRFMKQQEVGLPTHHSSAATTRDLGLQLTL